MERRFKLVTGQTGDGGGVRVISTEDYLYFAERAVAGMTTIVLELGDEAANMRAYEGANSPYALLHHCLAVVDTWVGCFVRGRPGERNRDAEFEAHGAVRDLVDRVGPVLERMWSDVRVSVPVAPLRREPPAEFFGPQRRLTQGGALQHVYEELAQHHGQMETLRDLLVLQRTSEVVP